jgi:hypothetical protein
LFHGRHQQSNGAQAHTVFGAHGGFHVFGNLGFETHGKSSKKDDEKKLA